jgi:Fic family protein
MASGSSIASFSSSTSARARGSKVPAATLDLDGAEPPGRLQVPEEIDLMCEYVQSFWNERSPLALASYVMWRLNWIHPFVDGNGRTSRAASYLVLCAKLGYRLPGAKTIPERIAENKRPYYQALDSADKAWQEGRVGVTEMERLLEDHLSAQLADVHHQAASGNRDTE